MMTLLLNKPTMNLNKKISSLLMLTKKEHLFSKKTKKIIIKDHLISRKIKS